MQPSPCPIPPSEGLWLRFRSSRNALLRAQLIEQYTPLVHYVIRRTGIGRPQLLDYEDLCSHGFIGLIQAVDRFDPSQGTKFESYAIQRIRGAILDAMRSLQPGSRDSCRRARELADAHAALTQRLGRTPEDTEALEHLGLTEAQVRHRLAEASPTIVSIDAPIGEEEGHSTLADQLADERVPDMASQVVHQELARHLIAAIERLSERDRLVIDLYYSEELTMREISRVLKISASRVLQLHAGVLDKLRVMLAVHSDLPAMRLTQSIEIGTPTRDTELAYCSGAA